MSKYVVLIERQIESTLSLEEIKTQIFKEGISVEEISKGNHEEYIINIYSGTIE